MFVPVVDSDGSPLMPTTPARARQWSQSGKATPFWRKGIWCVRLNIEPSARNTRAIAVGIDPGSKREGFTVKSELHTYLNIQAHAVYWVKEHVATRRMMRKSRRNRNCPCRKPGKNSCRAATISPSTKARWQWKLRILKWLQGMFPITHVIVEDICAKPQKGRRRWNYWFAMVQVGKNWFYERVQKDIGHVLLKTGYETFELRSLHGLKKSTNKLAETFSAHCVDSWVIANDYVGGHEVPDNTDVVTVVPLRFNRRRLHKLQPSKGGIRKRQGSTMSLGFKRGSIVVHKKYGEALIGGYGKLGISLHDRRTNERICRTAKPEDLVFRSYNSFLVR